MTQRSDSRFTIHLPLMCLLVFALASPASAEWKEKVLYSFQGIPDGSFPKGGVVFDKAGNLYGVTEEGGSGACAPAQCGIVYKLTPPEQKGGAWTETVLYVFKGQKYGDGSSPAGTLLIDNSGNLFGGTGYGGTGKIGCGTVYELSPPKEKEGARDLLLTGRIYRFLTTCDRRSGGGAELHKEKRLRSFGAVSCGIWPAMISCIHPRAEGGSHPFDGRVTGTTRIESVGSPCGSSFFVSGEAYEPMRNSGNSILLRVSWYFRRVTRLAENKYEELGTRLAII